MGDQGPREAGIQAKQPGVVEEPKEAESVVNFITYLCCLAEYSEFGKLRDDLESDLDPR